MKRNKLKVFRMTQELTQAQMAAKLGISEGHYKNIERGVSNPSFEVMSEFGEIFRNELAEAETTVWKLFKAT